MDKNVKIAKDIIKIAKLLVSDYRKQRERVGKYDEQSIQDMNTQRPVQWQVMDLDSYETNEGTFQIDINNSKEAFIFECGQDENVYKAFQSALRKNGRKVLYFQYSWIDDDFCYVDDGETEEPLYEFYKIKRLK